MVEGVDTGHTVWRRDAAAWTRAGGNGRAGESGDVRVGVGHLRRHKAELVDVHRGRVYRGRMPQINGQLLARERAGT